MTACTPRGALLAAGAATLVAVAAGAILLAELLRGAARRTPAAAEIQADYGPPPPRPEPYGAPLIREEHAPLPGHPAPFSTPQRYFRDLPEVGRRPEVSAVMRSARYG